MRPRMMLLLLLMQKSNLSQVWLTTEESAYSKLKNSDSRIEVLELIEVSKMVEETVKVSKTVDDSSNNILPEDHLKDNPDTELHDIQENTNIAVKTAKGVNKPATSALDDSKLSKKDLKRIGWGRKT